MSSSSTSAIAVNVGDKVRVIYPKQKYRSPHRTDGIYRVEKIDASYDVFWVRYLQDSKKITIVKRSYIQDVISSEFKGLD
jgi:hypothetical protein|tara:strand:+ start:835 stop:1074 length:240 start_codon:yes stop_codon:yes gene_type:complete